MPRHWRCANGHAWTGELGALTYCPDCGSADVYEVRPQYDSTAAASVDAGGHTLVQRIEKPRLVAEKAAAGTVADTLIQAPAAPTNVGDTLIQPGLRAGDTFVQPRDAGTTIMQVFVPADDGNTVIQAPVQESKDASTLDMPVLQAQDATVHQPGSSTADDDRPTVLAPPPTTPPAPAMKETFVYQVPVESSEASTPAETPTLDAPGGSSHRTADYASTVSYHRPAGEHRTGTVRVGHAGGPANSAAGSRQGWPEDPASRGL